MSQSHQSHHSRTGLTIHLLYACDAFPYLYVSFFYVLSLTMKNQTNQMVADPGMISLSIRQILHRQIQKIKERNVKIRKSVASIEKMTRQTRLRVMTLMTLIHLRKVIIDVDDAIIRSIGKRTRLDYAQL